MEAAAVTVETSVRPPVFLEFMEKSVSKPTETVLDGKTHSDHAVRMISGGLRAGVEDALTLNISSPQSQP